MKSNMPISAYLVEANNAAGVQPIHSNEPSASASESGGPPTMARVGSKQQSTALDDYQEAPIVHAQLNNKL